MSGSGEGSGAITLACLAVVSRLKSQPHSTGPVVIVSEGSGFYPPSAMAFGVPAQRMLWCELAVGEIRFGQWIKL